MLIGREKWKKIIESLAESSYVSNQVFLGVRGVGKTSLFQEYFSDEKKSSLAKDNNNLFIDAELNSRKGGEDLCKFILGKIIAGINGLVSDDDYSKIVKRYKSTLELGDLYSQLDILETVLKEIKKCEYRTVLVLDNFHTITCDSEIGRQQYESLRSLIDKGLISFWVVTDTDIIDGRVTEEYQGSYFSQKFTSRQTIDAIDPADRKELVKDFCKKKMANLSDDVIESIETISVGIPGLVDIMVDIAKLNENDTLTEDSVLESKACRSLFNSWLSGLSEDHNRILYHVSRGNSGAEELKEINEYVFGEMLDKSGRGILHSELKGDDRIYSFVVPVFQKYIVSLGNSFLGIKETALDSVNAANDGNTVVNNYYYYNNSNIINTEKIENKINVVNIDGAVNGLLDLYKYMSNNQALVDNERVKSELMYLPFAQDEWCELSEEEKDTECNNYAEGIFDAGVFSEESLTADQMNAFFLNDGILAELTEKTRKQLIAGIQVYMLIQKCIDTAGLNITESESPRGILFGRFFENHLKDTMFNAFSRIEVLSSLPANEKKKTLKEIGVDRTTIGTYSKMMTKKNVKTLLESATRQYAPNSYRDINWWDTYSDKLNVIRELRNDCCHSGTSFTKVHLSEMIKYMFEMQSISDAFVFNKIPSLSASQLSLQGKPDLKALLNNVPDVSMIGSIVQFEFVERSDGKVRGIVEGKYVGSILKSQSGQITAKPGDKMKVKVTNIQHGRCVLDTNV